MRTLICVNLVPYKEGSPRDIQQLSALMRLLDSDLGRVFVAVRDEAEEIEKRYPKLDILCLDRDAKKEIGGPRNLPFIKEMMQRVACIADTDPTVRWIGMLNSDILVTDDFERSAWASEKREDQGILIHRTDVAGICEAPQDKDVLHKGVDGFLVTPEVWSSLEHTYPDFALGEPGWGQGTEQWMQFHGLRHSKWTSHECLHVRHGAFWKRTRTAVANHNQRLFRQIKLLNETKGKL